MPRHMLCYLMTSCTFILNPACFESRTEGALQTAIFPNRIPAKFFFYVYSNTYASLLNLLVICPLALRILFAACSLIWPTFRRKKMRKRSGFLSFLSISWFLYWVLTNYWLNFPSCHEQALKELRAKAQQKGSFGGAGLKKSGKKWEGY